MKRNKFLFVLLMLLSILLVAFGSTFLYVKLNNKTASATSGAADDSYDGILIMTSCNPIYIATLNVVGDIDGIRVENLSQPTTGCLHDYTLTTMDMKNLSRADVLIVNGGGMEGYLDDVMLAYPKLLIIEATEDMELLSEEEEHEIHEDEDEEEHETHEHEGHDHGSVNSHCWMSSDFYRVQCAIIAEELGDEYHQYMSMFEANLDEYNARMDIAFGDTLNEAKSQLAGSNVAILHEAFEYIALETESEVVAVMDLDEERQTSAGEVAELIASIKDNDVRIVFAESDYGSSMGKLIEEQTDAKVVYLNTLIHGDYEKDSYELVMAENFELINKALAE